MAYSCPRRGPLLNSTGLSFYAVDGFLHRHESATDVGAIINASVESERTGPAAARVRWTERKRV
jgi:hypothetical protein